MRNAKVFAGSSHQDLAQAIVDRLGISCAPLAIKQHANHETSVDIGVSVRNQDVFIIQSGSDSINDSLMELMILINSCRISSASRITAILPYFPYAKQSKKKKSRGAVTAKLLANMLTVAGVDHIVTLDLHHDQMQGFFSKPVDNLLAEPSLCKYVAEHLDDYRHAVVVAKNPGGVKRVTQLADRLKIDFALIHQDKSVPKPAKASAPRRKTPSAAAGGAPPTLSTTANSSTSSTNLLQTAASTDSMAIATTHGPVRSTTTTANLDDVEMGGEDALHLVEVFETQWHEDGLQLVGDVDGRPCILVDDIVDKPSSFLSAAKLLRRRGATHVYVMATHGVLSNDALAQFEECDAIHKVIVTNSYPISLDKQAMSSKLEIIDISGVLAEAIRRTHNGESISYLFHTPL
ncbi:ribose-phosphate pyrophosphokinase 1 [Blastocladiella emersonii ATCC 22665]|nr:ribose-phosphate pyrophosphokinase 1 [Blastocladiella emersonii ATCC 22665]